MSAILKVCLLAIFGFIAFGRSLFSVQWLYWSMYVLMFALIPLLWRSMYWVSKKKAKDVLKGMEIDHDFFVMKVSENIQDNLQAGRLCFSENEVRLVSKSGCKFEVVWQADKNKIKSVGFGTVAGIRKGFILYFEGAEVSFVSAKLFKQRDGLYSALDLQAT